MYHLIMIPVGLLIGFLMLLCLPRLKDKPKKTSYCISVVIPARNEAANIAGIIADLQKQSLVPFEIICVDDHSDDETFAIAQKAGAKVISVTERPPGWVGKTFACQTGARAATGELILFLDADVRLSADALEKLAALYEKDHGVVSVQPYHTVKKFYEHFSMFFNIISVAATGLGLPFVKKTTGMYGPVVLVERTLYAQYGGHETVKSKVLEDFFLGKYYAKQNIPVTLSTGKGTITYRMYAGGLRELWQGWTKNFFSGAMSASVMWLVLVVIWVAALTGLVITLARTVISGQPDWWIYAAFYVLMCLEVRYASKKVGSFHWLSAVFFPVFLLSFHIIFLASLIKRLFIRSATWKGRKIKLGRDNDASDISA